MNREHLVAYLRALAVSLALVRQGKVADKVHAALERLRTSVDVPKIETCELWYDDGPVSFVAVNGKTVYESPSFQECERLADNLRSAIVDREAL